MKMRLTFIALLSAFAMSAPVHAAPFPTLSHDVGVCDPNAPQNCIKPDASGNVPVTGSFTANLGGFHPETSLTPITATTGGVSFSSFAAGKAVLVQNTGSTNAAFCFPGASSSASAMYVPPGGSALIQTTSETQVTCSTSTSTTTLNGQVGTGLWTGAGAGSGSGGGGSNASVSATGAAVPASGTYVGINVGGNLTGWDGAVKQATAANLNATVVGTGTFAVQAAQSGTWTVQPGNTANTTAWLVTGTGGTFPATQSGTWNINNISGAVSLPTGAATAANQTSQITQETNINTALGTPGGSTVCGTATGTCDITALIKFLNTSATTPLDNSSVKIDTASAATAQLVAISASTLVRVTSVSVIAGGTGTIKFVYGTGSNCGTGTTDLTGAYPLTAQAGLTLGSGIGTLFKSPAGNALCITTTGSVQMSGHVGYQQF